MANTVACSIVGTRIDYCNSLLYGVSEKYLDKLQHVQNKLARVVMNVGLRDHHTVDLLRELHWLPVRSRIIFKIAMLCHHVLQDSQPTYLAIKVDLYRPTRTLRSSDQDLLTEPASRSKTGARRFSCSAPKVWNSISHPIRTTASQTAFRTQLKTFLFADAFVTN